jgi:hypothetical protein
MANGMIGVKRQSGHGRDMGVEGLRLLVVWAS